MIKPSSPLFDSLEVPCASPCACRHGDRLNSRTHGCSHQKSKLIYFSCDTKLQWWNDERKGNTKMAFKIFYYE